MGFIMASSCVCTIILCWFPPPWASSLLCLVLSFSSKSLLLLSYYVYSVVLCFPSPWRSLPSFHDPLSNFTTYKPTYLYTHICCFKSTLYIRQKICGTLWGQLISFNVMTFSCPIFSVSWVCFSSWLHKIPLCTRTSPWMSRLVPLPG